MNNSSGIYQVDSLLKAKLQGSGLEPYVEVVAHIDTEAEKRLVPIYRLETSRREVHAGSTAGSRRLGAGFYRFKIPATCRVERRQARADSTGERRIRGLKFAA